MASDKFNIDGHKLHFHPKRVSQWLEGETIIPLYIEISPSGTCNHRCIFCSMDFMGYKKRFLDSAMMCNRLQEFGELGVRAVMFAGEGEPLMHSDICQMAEVAHTSGIDVAFTTNGVYLDEKTAERLLPVTSWIKVSCNAATAEEYAHVHRAPVKDFALVMKNVENAAKIRAQQGHSCTLGFQSILLPGYEKNLPAFARRAREAGADYLVIKPYTHSPLSLHNPFADVRYEAYAELEEALREEEKPDFKIIFRSAAMHRWDTQHTDFERCLALPFWTYVDSGANVWGCSRHMNEEQFRYGNLSNQTFSDIWMSEDRLSKLQQCTNNLDITNCHVVCRMESVNSYLWRLRHPYPHDNFI